MQGKCVIFAGLENARNGLRPLQQRLPVKLHYVDDTENITLYFYLFIWHRIQRSIWTKEKNRRATCKPHITTSQTRFGVMQSF